MANAGADQPPSAPDATVVAALLDAGAAVLGLPVEPAWRPAVVGHLAVTLGHGAAVLGFPLPDEVEAAPTYRP